MFAIIALSGKNFGIGFDFKDVTLAYQIPLYILPFSLLSFVLYIKTSISSHEVNGPASCWLFRNSRALILEISFCTLTSSLTEYLFFRFIFIFQFQASSISFIMKLLSVEVRETIFSSFNNVITSIEHYSSKFQGWSALFSQKL